MNTKVFYCLITTFIFAASYTQGQFFEGTITYKCSVTSPNQEFNSFFPPSIVFTVRNDSIRKSEFSNGSQSPIYTQLLLGYKEYQIDYDTRQVRRVKYLDSMNYYEGGFKIANFKRKKESTIINGYKCILYEYVDNNSKQSTIFWIDENFRFKRSSSQKLLLKEIGLVIKVEITSPNYSVEFVIDRIDLNKIHKKDFEFPANFRWSEFYPQSNFSQGKW
ncbi:MAG: hypothetical protein ACK514_07485 [Bacteroidota bacterium]|jgi:hypothetical protein